MNQQRIQIIEEIKEYLKLKGYQETEKDPGLPKCVELELLNKGELYYFSVMAITEKEEKLFDATVSTEWEVAHEHPNHFFFVVYRKGDNSPNRITLIPPERLIRFSKPKISSFQISFQISASDLDSIDSVQPASKKKCQNLMNTISIYNEFKKSAELFKNSY